MTYFSFSIYTCPNSVTDADLENVVIHSKELVNLDPYAPRFGPYALADWAKGQGLSAYYVDNCWVRVPVSAAKLKHFVSEVLHAGDELMTIVDSLDECEGRYLIVAEEF